MKKEAEFKWTFLVANVVLIVGIILFFVFYSSNNNNKLQEENLNNIRNLNQSASNVASSYFETKREKIADIVLYVQANGLNLNQTLEYINISTSSLGMNSIQLVATDCTGVSAQKDENGAFAVVKYTNGDYGRLQEIFRTTDVTGEILSSHEFTDSYNGIKSAALYTHIMLKGDDGANVPYTLMLLAKTSDIIDLINLDGGYDDMSTVLAYSNGDYIISNNSFKATNFYDYLYNYNGLSLDQKNEIKNEVLQNGKGELYYQDSKERDCVFRYEQISGNDWFCITVVPVKSFHMTNYVSSIILMTLMMFVLLGVDVSWLAVLNRKLKASMVQEQQANAAKSDFLSRMSHDIRTPLNGIMGSTLLALDNTNPPETDNYLRAINSSGSFLLGLVNDMLDMSKVESGKMVLMPEEYLPSELSEYINAVILPLANEKGITFKLSIDGDKNIAMITDRLRFNQICFNLLSNAVKFTPNGGTVEFIMKQTPTENGKALVKVTVRDNGIGMSEEYQKHMFESFSQENRQKHAASGTGLGLPIVKNLVELMGGTLAVESKTDVGTTFNLSFVFNVCASNTTEKTISNLSSKDFSLEGKKVLLCEDNELNMMIAVNILNKKGIIAETAENGRMGVDMFLNSEPGHYDAVLLDIMMPELDGLSATKEIRASSHPEAATIPIIAMTANAYAADIENCLEAGMNAHVAKPIEPAVLFKTLSEALEKNKAEKES